MICFHGLEPGVGSAVEVDWSRQATDAHHSASGDRRPASPLFWDTMRPVQVSLFSVKVHSGHGHALIAPSTIAAAFFIIELFFVFHSGANQGQYYSLHSHSRRHFLGQYPHEMRVTGTNSLRASSEMIFIFYDWSTLRFQG